MKKRSVSRQKSSVSRQKRSVYMKKRSMSRKQSVAAVDGVLPLETLLLRRFDLPEREGERVSLCVRM